MKPLRFVLGVAFIAAIGSAFASRPAARPTVNNFYLPDCTITAKPEDCNNGDQTCRVGGQPITQGATCATSTLVTEHP
jgi:hypothetical protein